MKLTHRTGKNATSLSFSLSLQVLLLRAIIRFGMRRNVPTRTTSPKCMNRNNRGPAGACNMQLAAREETYIFRSKGGGSLLRSLPGICHHAERQEAISRKTGITFYRHRKDLHTLRWETRSGLKRWDEAIDGTEGRKWAKCQILRDRHTTSCGVQTV